MSKILSLVKTIEVAWWCGKQQFKEELSLHQVEQLRTCDGLDEDQTNERRHPFVFLFSLQDDNVAFHEDMRDKREMQVF